MIAAIIVAHIVAVIRRPLVFLGLLRPLPHECADTLYQRGRVWLRMPAVRRGVAAALMLELTAGAAWAGVAHGQHLYRLGDQAVGALRGERVRYVGLCDRSGNNRVVRIVIDRQGAVTSQAV